MDLLLLAVSVGIAAILFLSWHNVDRYENEPKIVLICLLLLGFFLCPVSGKLLAVSGGLLAQKDILAGIFEELLKFLFILPAIYFIKEYDDAIDGVVYGVMIGIGFGLAEIFLYSGNLNFYRVLFNGAAHSLFAGITALVISLIKDKGNTGRVAKMLLTALAPLPAIFLHVLTNASFCYAGNSLAAKMFTDITILALVFVLFGIFIRYRMKTSPLLLPYCIRNLYKYLFIISSFKHLFGEKVKLPRIEQELPAITGFVANKICQKKFKDRHYSFMEEVFDTVMLMKYLGQSTIRNTGCSTKPLIELINSDNCRDKRSGAYTSDLDPKHTELRVVATYRALASLYESGFSSGDNGLNKKCAEWILSCLDNSGGFRSHPDGSNASLMNTMYALESLFLLKAQHTLSGKENSHCFEWIEKEWKNTGFKEFGADWWGEYYCYIRCLKLLGRLDATKQNEAVRCIGNLRWDFAGIVSFFNMIRMKLKYDAVIDRLFYSVKVFGEIDRNNQILCAETMIAKQAEVNLFTERIAGTLSEIESRLGSRLT